MTMTMTITLFNRIQAHTHNTHLVECVHENLCLISVNIFSFFDSSHPCPCLHRACRIARLSRAFPPGSLSLPPPPTLGLCVCLAYFLALSFDSFLLQTLSITLDGCRYFHLSSLLGIYCLSIPSISIYRMLFTQTLSICFSCCLRVCSFFLFFLPLSSSLLCCRME